jgi:hypothetical protein
MGIPRYPVAIVRRQVVRERSEPERVVLLCPVLPSP